MNAMNKVVGLGEVIPASTHQASLHLHHLPGAARMPCTKEVIILTGLRLSLTRWLANAGTELTFSGDENMTIIFRNLGEGFEGEMGVGPHYNFLGLMSHLPSWAFFPLKNYVV